MIDVEKAWRDLDAYPGDIVPFTKAQAAQMLGEVRMGQRARIALTNLKTQAVMAACSAGIAA